MPIGDFEREVLRVIAANRNPDSYLGGATVLHQRPDSPRSSRDVDLFHDTAESLARSVAADTQALEAAGFALELEKPQQTFQRAVVRRGSQSTRVEWVFDSAFRFFPVEPDPELGWRLSFWDAATNKVLALFSRQEFRDYVDAFYLHQRHLHLGALAWAAAGKDPGLTPELILDWIKRHTTYSPQQVREVILREPLDLVRMKSEWLRAVEEADALVAALPMPEVGCLYLDAAHQPVRPEPGSPAFATLTRHFASVKGAWPWVVGE